MTADNRVLALELALEPVTPQSGGLTIEQAATVGAVASMFYRFLEGPVVMFVTVDPTTYDQAAPEGPGTPTIRKGTIVQLNDRQGVDLILAELDSENQPVTGDNIAYSVDDPTVITITPSADGSSVRCAATLFADQVNGKLGSATVTLTDSTVSPPLTGTFAFNVVPSGPVSVALNPGTPFDLASAPAGP